MAVRCGRQARRPEHLNVGRRGEEAAYFYLRRRGMVVVARAWKSGKLPGDLDLIAWEDETLCFIEVKTRTSRSVATAESSVDEDKRRMLRRMARQYIQGLPSSPERTRFDVLSIYFEARNAADYEIFCGAFDWY